MLTLSLGHKLSWSLNKKKKITKTNSGTTQSGLHCDKSNQVDRL